MALAEKRLWLRPGVALLALLLGLAVVPMNLSRAQAAEKPTIIRIRNADEQSRVTMTKRRRRINKSNVQKSKRPKDQTGTDRGLERELARDPFRDPLSLRS